MSVGPVEQLPPLTDQFLHDIDLDPTRTTRRYNDPLEQRDEYALVRDDELLVDVTAYLPGEGFRWCAFRYSSHGSASVYPYKVQVPGRGEGQVRADEVRGWRRPLAVHRTLLEVAETRRRMEEAVG